MGAMIPLHTLYSLDNSKVMLLIVHNSVSTKPFHSPLAVDCGTLSSPMNGDVSLTGTTFESTAEYTCDSGFLLMGVESRQCLANRTWSDESPTCEGL